MTKNEVMQQALELIERLNKHGWILADFEDEVYATLDSLKAALEQPEQEQQQARVDVITVNLMREGINKHRARELADHFVNFTLTPPPPVQESVSMRMPKVGDRIVCLEDESLGKVVSLTAGGSPDILFDDGSRGTYMVREFAELFSYAEQRQPLTKDEALTLEALKYAASKGDGRIVREMKIAPFVIKEALAQPEQEDAFEGWVKIDELREHFNAVHCGTIYKHGGEGRVLLRAAPPKRKWVGLTGLEQKALMAMTSRDAVFETEVKLKEKNHG